MNDPEALFDGIAHDLKTPLAALRGFAELLATRDDEEIRRQAPRAILEAAASLSDALDDLLLAFELECGALVPREEPVPLAELVPTNGSLPTVIGDRALLRRALDLVRPDEAEALVSVEDAVVTIRARAATRKPIELYLARRIAELHGGELSETPDGLRLSLPLG